MTLILEILTPLLIAIIAWFLKRLIDSLDAKLDEALRAVRETNGGMRELRVWSVAHEKLDDGRYGSTVSSLEALRSKLDEMGK